MKKVVFDTNTLVSGLLWDGNEARIIEKAERKEIQLFISQKLIDELEGVLKRKKFSKRLEGKERTVNEAVVKIVLIATLTEPTYKIHVVKDDPDDNRVLECAVFAKADYIVSGDTHLLTLKEFEGIKILKAADFLEIFKCKE